MTFMLLTFSGMSNLVLILFIFTFAVTLRRAFSVFYMLRTKGNFYTAQRLCYEVGGILPYDNGTTLEEYMKSRNISSAWLNIRLRYLNYWTWVNGTEEEKFCDTCQTCGKVSLTSSILPNLADGISCENTNLGFICELHGRCPTAGKYQCMKHGGRYIMIGCESKNWFTARSICNKHLGDLLITTTKLKKALISTLLPSVKCPRNQEDFFIGLRRLEYFALTINEETQDVDHSKWHTEEPSQFRHCVEIQKETDGMFGWRTKGCFKLNEIVCEVKDPIEQSTISSSTPLKGTTTKHVYNETKRVAKTDPMGLALSDQNLVIYLLSPVCAASLIANIVLCIKFVYKRRRNESRGAGRTKFLPLCVKTEQ